MNAPIVRIYVVILVLFAGLVGFTSYWTVFHADDLKSNPLNHRPLIEAQRIHRGTITTSDGQVIAESVPQGGGGNPVYVRRYPTAQGDSPALFSAPLGYSYVQVGQTGLESAENNTLIGDTNEFSSILDQLRGQSQVGDNIQLTIDSNVQRTALEQLTQANANTAGSNGAGSVVAIDPRTGAIKAMVSTPGFDPNAVANTDTFNKLQQADGSPLLNRATQSQYPPGSTMKVVTAAAALDSGKFTPTSVLSGASPLTVSGAPLFNDSNEQFGDIDMTTALTHSVNTYFAQVGERIGPDTLVGYMKRFGFYSDPDLEYPDDQMIPTGPYNAAGKLVNIGFDVGRVAIGQGGAEGQLLATPMQMAEVAATVANAGVLAKPTFIQKVTDSDGRTVSELDPKAEAAAIKPETAKELTAMMLNVTQEGTATGLTVGGEPFAGKTGTAEIGDPALHVNQPWFIGFAPANDPKIAVAATIERCTSCFGGSVAGPIATAVMESALGLNQ